MKIIYVRVCYVYVLKFAPYQLPNVHWQHIYGIPQQHKKIIVETMIACFGI